MGKGNGIAGITGFLVGAGIGAILGILYAPRPGVETRAMVSDKVDDVCDEGQELYNRGVDRVMQVYTTATDRADEIASNVRPYVTGKNDELRDKIDEARERIAAQVNKNAAAAQDAINEKIPEAANKASEVAAEVKGAVKDAAEKVAPKKGEAAPAAE